MIAAVSPGAELEIIPDAQLQSAKTEPAGKTGSFLETLMHALSGEAGKDRPDGVAKVLTGKSGKGKGQPLGKTGKGEETAEMAEKTSKTGKTTGEKMLALKSDPAENGKAKTISARDGAGTGGIEDDASENLRKESAPADGFSREGRIVEIPLAQTRNNPNGVQEAVLQAPQFSNPGNLFAGTTVNGGPSSGERENHQHNENPAKQTGRMVVEVRDYRNGATPAVMAHATTGEPSDNNALNERTFEADRDNGGLEVRMVRFGHSEGNGQTAARTAHSDTFHTYLRESLSTQIVKHSGIILRNDDRGEIRLVLKPEHLGRVRLRIQLDDNRLTGRIFVDSAFVKESFEQNMASLYRAFKNSGFEASGFEVFVEGGKSETGSPDGSPNGPFDGLPQGAGGLAAKTAKQLDDSVPILDETGWQSDLINLMV